MIKRFHEAPKSIFKTVQKVTDGDYALVHLMDRDEEYATIFQEAVANGRETILDNSLFELGSSFNPDVFAEWVERMRPTYYVIPDVLENGSDNIDLCRDFLSKYSGLPGKTMGVVHGSSYEDFRECYKQMSKLCDKICISLDNPWWHSQLVEDKNVYSSLGELSEEANRRWCAEAMSGRASTIWRLRDDGVLCWDKPHHLLGCYLPQEMLLYKNFSFIESMDTCNPVVMGLNGDVYACGGPAMKYPAKMETMMNDEVSYDQLAAVLENISIFKSYCD